MTAFVALLASLLPPTSLQRTRQYSLPLPPKLHVTLDPEDVDEKAVFVIGDIHGCFEEFSELIDLATSMEPDTVIICAGDLINIGPDSAKVLSLARKLECRAVCGDHEESMLRECYRYEMLHDYELPDEYNWILSLDHLDIDFIANLPYTISIPSLDAIVVHAGLVPGLPLQRQHTDVMSHMKNIVEEDYFDGGGLVPCNTDKGEAWSTLWHGPEHVYYGHDDKQGLRRDVYATCLDTGCLYGGYLTGMFINKHKQTLQVEAKCTYAEKPE